MQFFLSRPLEERWFAMGQLREQMHEADDATIAAFNKILSILNAKGVEYLVVVAFAMAIHGMPRYTDDLDIFYRPGSANLERLQLALGIPIMIASDVDLDDLPEAGASFVIGQPPTCTHFMNSISGVTWEEALAGAIPLRANDVSTHFISLEQFAKNKKATGRMKDMVDLRLLEQQMRSAE